MDYPTGARHVPEKEGLLIEGSPSFLLHINGYQCALRFPLTDSGLWSKAAVRNAVRKGWITADEYAEIVGEPYDG